MALKDRASWLNPRSLARVPPYLWGSWIGLLGLIQSPLIDEGLRIEAPRAGQEAQGMTAEARRLPSHVQEPSPFHMKTLPHGAKRRGHEGQWSGP